MHPIDDSGTQQQDHQIHLTLSLADVEPIDLISLFQLACDQGQYGDADVIRAALIRSIDEYRHQSEHPAADEDDGEDEIDERGF